MFRAAAPGPYDEAIGMLPSSPEEEHSPVQVRTRWNQGQQPLTIFFVITAKATDENLTSEDWAAIMEVCDRVSSDTNGSQQAVQALIKRLAHRNANVQLYTLEVSSLMHLLEAYFTIAPLCPNNKTVST